MQSGGPSCMIAHVAVFYVCGNIFQLYCLFQFSIRYVAVWLRFGQFTLGLQFSQLFTVSDRQWIINMWNNIGGTIQ